NFVFIRPSLSDANVYSASYFLFPISYFCSDTTFFTVCYKRLFAVTAHARLIFPSLIYDA
ncbi:hypothetical protein N9R79_12640, partial [Vibrio sp.]|nr:hypothetical protein [Vibrio sp.]